MDPSWISADLKQALKAALGEARRPVLMEGFRFKQDADDR
jgi:hypothetical protein